ncbi:hypothetical protein OW492_00480 [Psychromonas sp. 14N.309.X.WAT.B.A12]|uniref:hypothetical protein n=1 Tax=Psychromonas sp. 14N.309.X.WAT.B.A12 TaxID=2998322 RepID=UPI0025B114BA|nr:hypothetical protein [Psychromonas sp. 14N.309.X.WAT.B.A12]MDN2661847.1 hypothetical protein [Psychromonas sp. 14N.309.X.WAT.B.A12]
MGFSERFTKKEAMALKRLGDSVLYYEYDKPPVDTFAIVELDVEHPGEYGTDTLTEITLSRETHPNVATNDEVRKESVTYRLTRKLRVQGSLITYSGVEV